MAGPTVVDPPDPLTPPSTPTPTPTPTPQAELEEGEGLPVGAFLDALNAPRLAHLRLTAEDYESVDVDKEYEEEEEEEVHR